MQQHATALGYVCIHWGWVEGAIDLLLAELTPLPGDGAHTCITANTDARAKIEMVKAIAFIRKPSDDWFNALLGWLNRIDNTLRPKRNRYIHDQWSGGPGNNPVKTHYRTKLTKKQAFEGLDLSRYEDAEIDLKDIWALALDLNNAGAALGFLLSEFKGVTTVRVPLPGK
jgi:hypothetical protein